MNSKVDLHQHTNYSDGFYSPAELVQKAKDAGLEVISITDHDSVNGIKEAIECGKDLGVEVISGVEISTDIEDQEVHLLGYFIDINNEELSKYLSFFREERVYRAKRIVNKLRNMGLNITLDDVMEHAKNSAVSRPHIAYVLFKLGITNSYYEAFNKYIGDNCPAFERKIHVSPQSAVKLINETGGLAFIAHPGFIKDSIIFNLIKAGIDGIEVIHPSHNRNMIKFYRGIVNQYCLLESGGSDFHGGEKGDEKNIGKYHISRSKLEAIRKMLIRTGS